MALSIEEETIDGYLVSKEIKKVWSVELDLAKHLLDVCKKHNLRIWASGGTLLGAIRHNGFIPWDDDMDFCMMRDDYNKLIEIGPSEFKDPYFFQSFYTDSFWGGMIKIRRSDTAMIPSHWNLREYNMGVFIDVFVMDAVPDNPKEFSSLYKKVKFYRRLLHNNNIVHPENLPFMRRIKHFFVSLLFRIVKPISIQNRIVNLLSYNSITNNTECGLIDFSALERHSINNISFRNNKHCYDDTILMPFCGIMIPVPIGYDALLKRTYGDYMTPKRGGQLHTNIVVDCDKPYKAVLREING